MSACKYSPFIGLVIPHTFSVVIRNYCTVSYNQQLCLVFLLLLVLRVGCPFFHTAKIIDTLAISVYFTVLFGIHYFYTVAIEPHGPVYLTGKHLFAVKRRAAIKKRRKNYTVKFL